MGFRLCPHKIRALIERGPTDLPAASNPEPNQTPNLAALWPWSSSFQNWNVYCLQATPVMELLLPQPEQAEMVICKGHRLREIRNWVHGSRDQSWPPGPLPAPSPLFTPWEPTPVRLWAPTWRDLASCAPCSFSLTHTWHTLGLEVWACSSIKADSDGKKVCPSPPTKSLRESCTAGWFAEASAGRWLEKFLELNTTIDSGIWKTLPTPQEEKEPLTTSKAPTFVAGVVMPAEWSRRSISPFFPWHRVSKNARLPQPGWRMSWAPGWDLSPRHPLLGLQQGLQLGVGGWFPTCTKRGAFKAFHQLRVWVS